MFWGQQRLVFLLIHAHSDSMRSWLWGEMFDNGSHIATHLYALRAFCVVLLVFSVCAVIDFLRIRLLEKPLFSFYDRMVGSH